MSFLDLLESNQKRNPLKSLHVDEIMVGLSSVCMPRTRLQSHKGQQPALSFYSTLINFLAYKVFTHPFFIQLRIWNFNWVSSILLRTLFSINWVKWKTIW